MSGAGRAEKVALSNQLAGIEVLKKQQEETKKISEASKVAQPAATPQQVSNKAAFNEGNQANVLNKAEGNAKPLFGDQTMGALKDALVDFKQLFKPVADQIKPDVTREAPKEKSLVSKESEMFKPVVKDSGSSDKAQEDLLKRTTDRATSNIDAVSQFKDDLTKKQTEAPPAQVV